MLASFSIIITVYNHKNYIEQLREMLEKQTCRDFELIIIDNNSTDDSSPFWENFTVSGIKAQYIYNETNLGICKAFNQGVQLSQGKYLIDLSPDDEFLPNKLERNLVTLEANNVNLLFSDCELITENRENLGKYSDLHPFYYKGVGNYFSHILERNRIASPTIVFSRVLFDSLGGYDESLAYEDFDFISRSTKKSDLVYDSEVLVRKHKALKSLSTQFKNRNSHLHESTYKVCLKLLQLCATKEEKKALKSRIFIEQKAQIRLLNFSFVWRYFTLAKQIKV
jgi:glycosyltransferase involved in cell wall biosynthesis